MQATSGSRKARMAARALPTMHAPEEGRACEEAGNKARDEQIRHIARLDGEELLA